MHMHFDGSNPSGISYNHQVKYGSYYMNRIYNITRCNITYDIVLDPTHFERPLDSRSQMTDTLLRVHKQHANQLQRHNRSIHRRPGNRPRRLEEMPVLSRSDLRPRTQT